MGGEEAGGATWTYDVVGYHGGDFGLAVAARESLAVLRASGRGTRAIQIAPAPLPSIPARIARTLRRRRTVDPGPGPRVALFQANPVELARFHDQWQGAVSPRARTACVPFWELPILPRSWERVLRGMDVVLAPSRFIQEACARVVGADRVLHYPQSVGVPDGVAPCREAWGLSSTATVLVVSFDLGSGADRKNPWAALEAFRRAFPGREDVQLVVKTRPWPEIPAFAADLERLRAASAGDARIRIVDRSLPYAEVLGLYASADVLVSLHRSEGLGLHLLEAMALGKVVVATGWSGNLEFTTRENSVLVPYTLVPVEPTHPHFASERGRSGQVWAEPDVDAAARALRALHEKPERRVALGRRAAADAAARRGEALGGRSFGELERRLVTLPRRNLRSAVFWTRRAMTARGWLGMLRGAR
ncbi:MAG TPA: glycosyltransferase [Anaeromyxobacteraceae bacterium]|nr:glycosyltransferase [Anaeromyxobacteraceae bacterium]